MNAIRLADYYAIYRTRMTQLLFDRISGRLGGTATWFEETMCSFVARRPLKLPEHARLVTFTFDDFPQTAADEGAGILEAENARGTFYVNFGLLGQDRACGPAVDQDGVIRLSQRGHEIGCHTYGHLDLTRTSQKDLIIDLDTNDAHARRAGLQLRNFAYPFGKVSWRNKSVVAQRFASARGVGWTQSQKIIRGKFDAAHLPAHPLDRGAEHERSTSALLDSVAESGGWLIFVLHDVAVEPSRWGVMPGQLRSLVRAVLERGIQVATIYDALSSATFEPIRGEHAYHSCL